MKGRVIAGKVALELLETPSQTKGGIYVPENAKKNDVKAKVIAVGISTEDEKMEVLPGDTILVKDYSGTKFELDGKQYKLVNHKDILFII